MAEHGTSYAQSRTATPDKTEHRVQSVGGCVVELTARWTFNGRRFKSVAQIPLAKVGLVGASASSYAHGDVNDDIAPYCFGVQAAEQLIEIVHDDEDDPAKHDTYTNAATTFCLGGRKAAEEGLRLARESIVACGGQPLFKG